MDLTSSRSSWFAPGLRTKTAPEFVDLLELDLRNVQKAAYDESGEDVRLKWPETGSRWSSLRERRKWFVRECQEKMEESFDKLYEHFAEKKRLSQGWYMYLLPTMKTPSLRKHQSQVQHMQGDAVYEVEPVPSNPPATTNPRRTTRACRKPQVTTDVVLDDLEVLPATTTRKTTRARTKKAEKDSTSQGHEDSFLVRNDHSLVDVVATSSRRMTRSRIKTAAAVVLTESERERPAPESAVKSQTDGNSLVDVVATCSRRMTRSRIKTAATVVSTESEREIPVPVSVSKSQTDGNSLIDVVATSSHRKTRSTIKTAAAVVSKESERETPVPMSVSKSQTADTDPESGSSSISAKAAESNQNQETVQCKHPVVPQSRQNESMDTPDLVISPPQIRESTGRGLSRRSSLKVLGEVAVEKLQVSSPAIEPSNPPISFQPMETENATTGDQSPVPIPATSSIVPAVRRSVRLRKVTPGTRIVSCMSDSDDESYIRPPPPKRSLLKLKKKSKQAGRKGRKPPRKLEEDLVITESQTSSGESAVVVYPNKTPRVIRQLHEQHQVRSGGKIISLAELRSRNSPAPCRSSKKGSTPGFSHSPQVVCTKATVGGAQCQARASPLEKMDAMHSTEETETTDNSQEKDSTPSASSDSAENYSSPDDMTQSSPKYNEDSLPQSESSQSGQPKSASKMGFIWNLFGKKVEGSKMTAAGGSNQLPLSFLPRNSPMKQDLFEVRHQKLAEKIQRKKEDEERRKRELEAKRQQELQDKIKRREERAKRVAENQAVLAREEQERRKRMEGQRKKDELLKKEKIHQQKAKEFEQKTKKQKERMHAAELRRRQEEEQKLQRLYQLQEERRMQEELTKKRMEQEEAEKRVRRVERQKAEQERQLQREAEREAEKRQRIEEELQAKEARHLQEELESKRQQEAVRKQQEHLRKEEEKRKFEKLLGGHAKTTTNATMNSTFTIQTATVVTPAPNSSNKPKYTVTSSYEMTPIQQQDPFSIYENYDIGDLGSDDSTDEEDCPKKVIPLWAHPTELGKLMQSQEKKVDSRVINIHKIFPPNELLLAPDLARIFKHKRKRFYHRSSSARWDSPMLKKSRVI